MRQTLCGLLAVLLALGVGAVGARGANDDDQDFEILHRVFGGYSLDIKNTLPRSWLTVRHDGKIVFERRDTETPWGVGHQFSLTGDFKAGKSSPFSDPRKALIVRDVSGGLHCCDSALVFLLEPEFHFLAEVPYVFWDVPDAPSAHRPTVADLLVLDAGPEPQGSAPSQIFCEVNLRLRDQALHVDAELQRQPPYSRRFLTFLAGRLHEAREWGDAAGALTDQDNPALVQFMMALIYTGNADQARQLMEMAWRDDIPGKEDWAADFWAARKSSPYWQEIAALSAAPGRDRGDERDKDIWPICYPTGDQG